MKKDLTKDVRKIVISKGADMIGIAPVERFQGAPKSHHPAEVLHGCESVISHRETLFNGHDR